MRGRADGGVIRRRSGVDGGDREVGLRAGVGEALGRVRWRGGVEERNRG